MVWNSPATLARDRVVAATRTTQLEGIAFRSGAQPRYANNSPTTLAKDRSEDFVKDQSEDAPYGAVKDQRSE